MQSVSGHIMHLFLSIFAIICNLLEKTGACNGNLAYNAGVFGGIPDIIHIMSISFSAENPDKPGIFTTLVSPGG